jgi:hypothetical protein
VFRGELQGRPSIAHAGGSAWRDSFAAHTESDPSLDWGMARDRNGRRPPTRCTCSASDSVWRCKARGRRSPRRDPCAPPTPSYAKLPRDTARGAWLSNRRVMRGTC